MPKRNYSILFFTLYLLPFVLSACIGQVDDSTATFVPTVKALATVFTTATPNPEEAAATRAAISVTPVPPTATIIPSETPYIGIFIGEAEQERGLVEITSPLFGPNANNPDTVIRIQQATADANLCPLPIEAPYLTAWRTNPIVNQRLGCPIQGGFGFFGNVQVFANGVMYYYPEFNAIWAIRPLQEGNRGRYDYLENPPEGSTIGLQADTGFIVPGDIFGDMWLAVSGLREDMGFARTESQETPMGLQRFNNGIFIHDVLAGQVYALIVDGTVLGPYLAPEPSSVTPTPAATAEEGAVDEGN
jgi:hypothetical protein